MFASPLCRFSEGSIIFCTSLFGSFAKLRAHSKMLLTFLPLTHLFMLAPRTTERRRRKNGRFHAGSSSTSVNCSTPRTTSFRARIRGRRRVRSYKDFDDFCESVNGIMERVIQQCCNQFPREIHRFSTQGKQSMLQLPRPRPKQQKKCCGSISK